MSIVFQQSCTGADGTDITTISPEVGSNLVNVTNSLVVTSNRARVSGTNSTGTVRTNQTLPSANYIVRATLRQISLVSQAVSIRGRYIDESNYVEAIYSFSLGNIRLRKNVAGTITQIGSAVSWTPGTTQDHILELRLDGSNWSVIRNGTTIISGTDTDLASASNCSWSVATNGTNNATNHMHIRQLEVDTLGTANGRRRITLGAPKNTKRPFKPQSRMLFGATRTLVLLPADYYLPRTPTVRHGSTITATATVAPTLNPTVTRIR